MDPTSVVSDPFEIYQLAATVIVGKLALVITVLWRKTESHSKKTELMLDAALAKCDACEKDRLELVKKVAFLEGRLSESNDEHSCGDCGEG